MVGSHRIVWDPIDPTIWLDFLFIYLILSGIYLGKIIHLNPQAQQVIRSPIMN